MSSSVYFLYNTLQRATGAKLCCLAKFYNGREDNIITCSSDTLVVYSVVKYDHDAVGKDNKLTPVYKLKIVDEFPLQGEILSVATIPLRKLSSLYSDDSRDALILSFRGNYISTIAYDEQNGGLQDFDCLDLNKDAAVALDGTVDFGWMNTSFRKRN